MHTGELTARFRGDERLGPPGGVLSALRESGFTMVSSSGGCEDPYTATMAGQADWTIEVTRGPNDEGYDLELSATNLGGPVSWLRAVVLLGTAFERSDCTWGATNPAYRHRWRERGPDIDEQLSDAALTDVGYVTFYGPDAASTVGRDRLRTAPALAYRNHDDGGLTLVVTACEDDDRVHRVQSGLDATATTEGDESGASSDERVGPTELDRRPSYDRGPVPLEAPPDDTTDDIVGLLVHLGLWERDCLEGQLWSHGDTRDRLEQALSDDRATVQTEAAWGLQGGVRDDIVEEERLRSVLAHETPGVRAVGVELLNSAAGKNDRSVDAETANRIRDMAIDDPSPRVRRAAVRRLGRYAPTPLGHKDVSTVHRTAFDANEHRYVRVAAVEGIRSHTNDQSMPHDLDLLFEALVDDDPAVRAAVPLRGGPWRPATRIDPDDDRHRRKRDILEKGVLEHRDLLVEAIDSDDRRSRSIAVRLAGLLPTKDARKFLSDGIESDDALVREAASRSAPQIECDIGDVLSKLLVDESDDVREAAAFTIKQVAHTHPEIFDDHLHAIFHGLDEQPIDVCWHISQTVGNLDPPKSGLRRLYERSNAKSDDDNRWRQIRNRARWELLGDDAATRPIITGLPSFDDI